MSNWSLIAEPSGVAMNVRIVWPSITSRDLGAVAEAIDGFVYELCEVCGYDLDGHVVVPGPLGHPHLWCQTGQG